jgi:hypothetical protein
MPLRGVEQRLDLGATRLEDVRDFLRLAARHADVVLALTPFGST